MRGLEERVEKEEITEGRKTGTVERVEKARGRNSGRQGQAASISVSIKKGTRGKSEKGRIWVRVETAIEKNFSRKVEKGAK